MIDKIKESLEAIHEIFNLLISLKNIVKKYPAFFISLASTALLYVVIFWYANYYPGLIIQSYFESLGNRKYDYAWELLSPQYKDPRWESFNSFQQAYITSVPHEELKVSPKESSFWIFPTLFSESLRFEAEYEVTERFTKNDIEKPEQHINSLWLQIHHRRDYKKLINTGLNETESGNPSLALRRYFKTTVVIHRKPNEETGLTSIFSIPSKWQIHNMNFTEQGLKPLQGFQ